ncbi:unnamed protein product [Protopolystoma xenopodis]|uniref:Uncharacterized protein n=1 Tax=Protopolystoma xenopodis TaxID=117903 RepID=A0A3S5BAQ6_9PLAT|nr:unnamed protein product [Protopolystoma xenopodis]
MAMSLMALFKLQQPPCLNCDSSRRRLPTAPLVVVVHISLLMNCIAAGEGPGGRGSGFSLKVPNSRPRRNTLSLLLNASGTLSKSSLAVTVGPNASSNTLTHSSAGLIGDSLGHACLRRASASGTISRRDSNNEVELTAQHGLLHNWRTGRNTPTASFNCQAQSQRDQNSQNNNHHQSLSRRFGLASASLAFFPFHSSISSRELRSGNGVGGIQACTTDLTQVLGVSICVCTCTEDNNHQANITGLASTEVACKVDDINQAGKLKENMKHQEAFQTINGHALDSHASSSCIRSSASLSDILCSSCGGSLLPGGSLPIQAKPMGLSGANNSFSSNLSTTIFLTCVSGGLSSANDALVSKGHAQQAGLEARIFSMDIRRCRHFLDCVIEFISNNLNIHHFLGP